MKGGRILRGGEGRGGACTHAESYLLHGEGGPSLPLIGLRCNV